jgi:hypothetical protein
MRRGYLIYGLLVLSILVVAEYRGWSFLPVSQVRQDIVPGSIRDNPAAYRTQFIRNTRYVGGK